MENKEEVKAVEEKVPTAAVETKEEKVEEVVVPEAVDYKAELEASLARETKVTQERDNYKAGLLVAKGKRHDESVIVTDKKELNRIVDARVAELAGSLVPNVQSILKELTSDADEQALVQHIYDTRITHTGLSAEDLRNDLEEAQLIANKKSVKKTISELRVAAQHRPTPGSGAGASTTQTQVSGDPDFTPAQLEYFKKRNLDPNTVRQNLKRLPVNGPVSSK